MAFSFSFCSTQFLLVSPEDLLWSKVHDVPLFNDIDVLILQHTVC